MSSPDVFNKAIIFLCFAFFMCAAWSLLGMQFAALAGFAASFALVRKYKSEKVNALDIAVIIYLSAVLLSLLSSPDITFDAMRSTSFWTIAVYVPFRCGASSVLKSPRLFGSMAAILIVVCLYSILQAFLGFDIMRGAAPLSYPNPGGVSPYAVIGFFDRHHTFAASISMLTLFSISGLLQNENKIKHILILLLISGSTAAIFLAQSRAVFVALPFAVMPFVLQKFRKPAFLLALAAVLIIPALLLSANDTARDRLLHPINSEDARIRIMQTAAVAQAERPLSGWGFGHFYSAADNYFDAAQADVHVRSGTHNDVQQMFFDGGIPLAFAFALLLSTIFSFACTLTLRNNEHAAGIFGSMLIFALYGLFHNAMADGELSLLFWALAGSLSSLKKQVSC